MGGASRHERDAAAFETIHCGFQQTRRSWFGHRLLDACMVRAGDNPDAAAVTSHGTYRRHQFLLLASVKEWEFPPRPLGLALRIHDDVLAWQGVVDVPGEGVHTLIIAAVGGRLLFHKFDPYRGPRETAG